MLVNNAGFSIWGPTEKTTVEDFDALFAGNVRAPYLLVGAFVHLLPREVQHRPPLHRQHIAPNAVTVELPAARVPREPVRFDRDAHAGVGEVDAVAADLVLHNRRGEAGLAQDAQEARLQHALRDGRRARVDQPL